MVWDRKLRPFHTAPPLHHCLAHTVPLLAKMKWTALSRDRPHRLLRPVSLTAGAESSGIPVKKKKKELSGQIQLPSPRALDTQEL